MFLKVETKRSIWSFTKVRLWAWWPDVVWGQDIGRVHWLLFVLERISKEWLDYCDRKGFGFADAFEMIEREIQTEE